MAVAYSIDLRERVAQAWDETGDADEIAATFRVSRAWVHRLIQRRRDTGSLAPRKQTKFTRGNQRQDFVWAEASACTKRHRADRAPVDARAQRPRFRRRAFMNSPPDRGADLLKFGLAGFLPTRDRLGTSRGPPRSARGLLRDYYRAA